MNTLMKLLKSILILILVLSFVSCKKEASDKKPNATGTSYATLIAYSIHGKHKRSDKLVKKGLMEKGTSDDKKSNVVYYVESELDFVNKDDERNYKLKKLLND